MWFVMLCLQELSFWRRYLLHLGYRVCVTCTTCAVKTYSGDSDLWHTSLKHVAYMPGQLSDQQLLVWLLLQVLDRTQYKKAMLEKLIWIW